MTNRGQATTTRPRSGRRPSPSPPRRNHVLYVESKDLLPGPEYGINLLRFSGLDPRHPYEALGYLWEGYIAAYGNAKLGPKYGDDQPWCSFLPRASSWEYCAGG